MKAIVFVLILVISAAGFNGSKSPKIKFGDLKLLTGTKWKGELSYLDYRSNKKVSIHSNLTVTQSTQDKTIWIFEYEYPLEPQANKKVQVQINNDGKTFHNAAVIEKAKLADGTIKIITTEEGTDNDKKAVFRYIYLINKQSFSIKKEVKYEGTNEFFQRNEYSWKR